MRQHVFAFVVALAVWVVIGIAHTGFTALRANAQTGDIWSRCVRVAYPIGNAEKRCVPPACSSNCRGRVVLGGQCEVPGPPNTTCVAFYSLTPVYYIYSTGCVYYAGSCYCTNQWVLGEKTGETEITPDCREAVGGSGGGE
ncbi:MAG: hypothetical protein KatS3mg022_1568 [Armatimonadota bacterium]|nr:MAG: hypothetical protein KatS3mg022_1568 [Armatimonadota bacterium]